MGCLYNPRFKRPDGMAYRHPGWRAKYYPDGCPIRQSIGTDKEAEPGGPRAARRAGRGLSQGLLGGGTT